MSQLILSLIVASNARSLQENSQSEHVKYCSHKPIIQSYSNDKYNKIMDILIKILLQSYYSFYSAKIPWILRHFTCKCEIECNFVYINAQILQV